MKRQRILYLLTTTAVIALGLLVRREQNWLPEVINLYLGDALYAVMMFFIYSFLVPGNRGLYKASYALATCWCIELLQLYTAPWIMSVRATLPGRLVLGQGFLWSDILAYAIGVAVAFSIDSVWRAYTKISR